MQAVGETNPRGGATFFLKSRLPGAPTKAEGLSAPRAAGLKKKIAAPRARDFKLVEETMSGCVLRDELHIS